MEVSIRNFRLILLAEISQNGTDRPFMRSFADGKASWKALERLVIRNLRYWG